MKEKATITVKLTETELFWTLMDAFRKGAKYIRVLTGDNPDGAERISASIEYLAALGKLDDALNEPAPEPPTDE